MIFKRKKEISKNFDILGTKFAIIKKRQVWTRIYEEIENNNERSR